MSDGTTIHMVRGLRIAVTQLDDSWCAARLKIGSETFSVKVAREGEIAALPTGPARTGGDIDPADWLPAEVQSAIRAAVREHWDRTGG